MRISEQRSNILPSQQQKSNNFRCQTLKNRTSITLNQALPITSLKLSARSHFKSFNIQFFSGLLRFRQ